MRKIYRYFVRVFLKRIGISNILIIVKANLESFAHNKHEIVQILSSDLSKDLSFKIHKKLKKEISRFQEFDSTLYFIAERNEIIAYCWSHLNFDPDNDIRGVKENSYSVIGPAFVKKNKRKSNLFSKILITQFRHLSELEIPVAYGKISFDNLPSLIANNKYGFKVFQITYKTPGGHLIIS